MTDSPNPPRRPYNDAEVQAATRLGLVASHDDLGALTYLAGRYRADHARAMARDWAIVANALDRELSRDPDGNLPDGVSSPVIDAQVAAFQAPRHTVEEAVLGGPGGIVGYLYQCTDCGWSATDPNPTIIGSCPFCRGRMSRRWTENP